MCGKKGAFQDPTSHPNYPVACPHATTSTQSKFDAGTVPCSWRDEKL